MTGFAIMDARVIATLLRQVPLSAERIESQLEACKLPGRIFEDPVGLIPLPAVERFISAISVKIGDPNFAFSCLEAEVPVSPDAVASIPIPRRLTGLDSVFAFAANIDACVTRAHFFCQIEGPRLWIRRTMGTTEWTGSRSVQLYNLNGILSGMRRMLGPGTRPIAVRMNDPGPKHGLPEDLRGIPVLPAEDALGLAFPLMEIAMHGARPGRLAPASRPGTGSDTGEIDPADLVTCLAGYLGNPDTGRLEEAVAGAFGMSTRSYRRHLARRGTSHRQLVDEARLMRALQLLIDRSMTLTDVALELGYSDRSHFTRFFVRRVGISPHAYRQARLAQDACLSDDPEIGAAAIGGGIGARWSGQRAYPYS